MPLSTATYVRLRKLIEIAEGAPSLTWQDWDPARESQTHSLPVAYELEGWLLLPIEIGRPIMVLRTARNGVEQLGEFTSSVVHELRGDRVRTANSVYRVEVL